MPQRRPKKMLLAATALVCGPLELACHQQPDPLPGNPKGSVYDQHAVVVPDAGASADGAAPDPERDDAGSDAAAQPDGGPLPTLKVAPDVSRPEKPYVRSNPKGSHYDHGSAVVPTKPTMPANPKGSHYDAGSARKKVPTGR